MSNLLFDYKNLDVF